MSRHGETCQLCHTGGLNLKEGKGDELTDLDHLDTFNFLAGINSKGNATKLVKRFVCQTCSAKVKLISSIRSESVKAKTETGVIEVLHREAKQHREDEDEDLDLEELDQLSLFYAEHDDPDKDPDFAPKTPKKSNKRSIKRPKGIQPSVTTTKEPTKDLVETSVYFWTKV